jgi:hypothetical protein
MRLFGLPLPVVGVVDQCIPEDEGKQIYII